MHINLEALYIPIIFALVALEWLISKWKNVKIFRLRESITNIACGVAEQGVSLLSIYMLFLIFQYIHANFSLFEISMNAWSWVFLILATDFMTYWYHRAGHEVNIIWASHSTHHQSEEYNLTVGFRISFLSTFPGFIFKGLPLVVLGFDTKHLVVAYSILGLYQWILHTKFVGKLGFLEHILMTPSAHRVHHGRNDCYLDKNYGGMFIFWDKLFGTYAEEKEDVLYGVTTRFREPNAFKAYFVHYQYLFSILKNVQSWWEVGQVLFCKPGKEPQHLKYKQELSKKNYAVDTRTYWYGILMAWVEVGAVFLLLAYKEFTDPSRLEIVGLLTALSVLLLPHIFAKNPFKNTTECLRIALLPVRFLIFMPSVYMFEIGILFAFINLLTYYVLLGGSTNYLQLIHERIFKFNKLF